MKKCQCQKCNYQWEPRKEKPKACPECKSRDWYKELLKEDVKSLIDGLRNAVLEYSKINTDDKNNDTESSDILSHIESLKKLGVSIDEIKRLMSNSYE